MNTTKMLLHASFFTFYLMTVCVPAFADYTDSILPGETTLVFPNNYPGQQLPAISDHNDPMVDRMKRKEERRRLREERKHDRKDGKRKDKKRPKPEIVISESVYNNAVNPNVGSVNLNSRVTPIYPRSPPPATPVITAFNKDLDANWLISNISELWQVVRKLENDIVHQKQTGGRSSNRSFGKNNKLPPVTCESNIPSTACIDSGSSQICSTKGMCVCGMCECTPPTYGAFCQCDDTSCGRNNGMICGGPYRGQCRCGKCLCRPGYVGAACECSTSTASCAPSQDSFNICSGRGVCNCGRCQCNDGYKGTYCEDNVYAAGTCERLKPCVLCKAFGRNLPQCQDCQITMETVDKLETNLTTCVMVSMGCLFKYSYIPDGSGSYIVSVPKTKICTPPPL